MNQEPSPPRIQSVALTRLRPTQLTIGLLEVEHKRSRLRQLEKRPSELVAYILEMPIRVVLGPADRAYVIDHHHLGLALIDEHFETAPMAITADFSHLPAKRFWKRMHADHYLHLVSAKGVTKPLRSLPKDLRKLKDDPYRSLAGFVRTAGGYTKTEAPFAEFQWADFFRARIKAKSLRKRFERCVREAVRMAKSKDAAGLPGWVGKGDISVGRASARVGRSIPRAEARATK
jgi:hypothetical protein